LRHRKVNHCFGKIPYLRLEREGGIMGLVEQRAAFRFPTNLEAECRMAGRTWPSRLCNVSTTGCMLACPEEGLPDGWMMRLRVHGLPVIDAEIVWQHRGHAGLHFLVALHPTALEHLGFHLPEPRPSALPETLREPGGLHASLVKRAPPDEGLRAGTGAEVRGSLQPLA
jgi:hypothetical protein